MNLPAAILADIERYGSTLSIGPDTQRPWTVAYRATLQPRSGPTLIGKGNTPDAAIADLAAGLPYATR